MLYVAPSGIIVTRAGPPCVVRAVRLVIFSARWLKPMMQSTSPLAGIAPDLDTQGVSAPTALTIEDRIATIWVGRITRIVGAICLVLAIIEWAFRQGHYRTVLALLTLAMFAAILHSYTFEDGS